MSKMIRTFIFFDLETTGLIRKTLMPKITELSMIAVSRDAICNDSNILPRVLQKLVLPINPNTEIPKEVQKLTKLSHENLEEIKPFEDETYELIMSFMKRLAAPICFVAYNGNKFDYPILLAELKTVNKNLDEAILSIDMLNLIREFFTNSSSKIEQVVSMQNISSTSFSSTELNIILNDDDDKMLCEVLDSIMTTDTNNCKKTQIRKNSTSLANNNNADCNSSNDVLQTPKTNCYKTMQEQNEKTPEDQIVKLTDGNITVQVKNKITARRKLDFMSNRPSNFKLTTVAKYILGTDPENAHSAEGDCLTMLRCASQLGNFFNEWADYNAISLINFEKS